VHIFGEPVTAFTLVFLLLALGLALSFEFVNGFHDTANAVATVIYTHTLRPNVAVVWSGLWNLAGVMVSAGAVAFSIVALLPVELVINVGSGAGWAMVFALLISAIIWNLGTWYLGLPASSSHTLIGSIMGVGFANSMLSAGHVFGEGVNWSKAKEVGSSLLISPIMGFVFAGLLLLTLKMLVKNKDLYHSPEKDQPPPPWIRGLLILTCTGVSFFHGSNDGQKGMGLIMLIMIGILPGAFALNLSMNQTEVQKIVASAHAAQPVLNQQSHNDPLTPQVANEVLSSFLKTTGHASDSTFAALATMDSTITTRLDGVKTFAELPREERKTVRTQFYLVAGSIDKLNKLKLLTDPQQKKTLIDLRSALDKATKFIPTWVKVAVALALGLGTMIGWKRIVVTVGEKIGKSHLTYAEGASAEVVAMCTIGLADYFGLPVSTTHVLSSGVAGTMAANGSGVQMNTLRNLLLAWVLTLPVCVFLGAATFAAGFYVVLAMGLK
jgi:inorganic phosphate transporter, PiT family